MLNHLSLKTSSVFSPLCVCERERKRVRQRERERKKESERERARKKGRRKRERKPERARERVRSHLAGLVSRVSRFSWFDWNQDFLGREWISSSCSICDPQQFVTNLISKLRRGISLRGGCCYLGMKPMPTMA